MSATSLLILLVGEIALLLFGIQTVHTAITRGFGSELRRVVGHAVESRWRAFLAGVGVTSALQSSTATAMMVSSFAASGMIGVMPALAVMLGANVGTTLIAQVLSFDVDMIYPVLLAGGLGVEKLGRTARAREVGRALLGLGLVLMALRLIEDAIAPVSGNADIRMLLHALTRDPLLNLLIAAVIAWLAHASLVSVLFVMSLAAAQVIEPPAALAMIAGANLGAAFNPLLEGAGRHGGPARLRVPVGNLITRVTGCVLVLAFLHPLAALGARLDSDPARLAANAHTAFNVVLAALFIGPLPYLARFLVWLLPDKADSADPARPRYLATEAIGTPQVALTNAAREVLRMADVAETMLRGSRDAFGLDDREGVAAVSRMDDVLDGLYGAISRYLNAVGRSALTETETRRLSEILVFAVNLEHVGDIIDKNLMELASKRIDLQVHLAHEVMAEISDMHERLIDHLQLAISVFLAGDTGAARRLVEEKEQFRDLEKAAARRYFDRVTQGTVSGFEAMGLELDIVRDLKRIEAHIAATAYPLLEMSGDLMPSRLSP